MVKVYFDRVYVDPLGSCMGNQPCFNSINSMINSELVGPNTDVYLYSGVYRDFNLDGKTDRIIAVNGSVVFDEIFNIENIRNLEIEGVIFNLSSNFQNIKNIFELELRNVSIYNKWVWDHVYIFITNISNVRILNTTIFLVENDWNYDIEIRLFDQVSNLSIVNSSFLVRSSGPMSNSRNSIIFRNIQSINMENVVIHTNRIPNFRGFLGNITFHSYHNLNFRNVTILDQSNGNGVYLIHLSPLYPTLQRINSENFVFISNNISGIIQIRSNISNIMIENASAIYLLNARNISIVQPRNRSNIVISSSIYQSTPKSYSIINSANISLNISSLNAPSVIVYSSTNVDLFYSNPRGIDISLPYNYDRTISIIDIINSNNLSLRFANNSYKTPGTVKIYNSRNIQIENLSVYRLNLENFYLLNTRINSTVVMQNSDIDIFTNVFSGYPNSQGSVITTSIRNSLISLYLVDSRLIDIASAVANDTRIIEIINTTLDRFMLKDDRSQLTLNNVNYTLRFYNLNISTSPATFSHLYAEIESDNYDTYIPSIYMLSLTNFNQSIFIQLENVSITNPIGSPIGVLTGSRVDLFLSNVSYLGPSDTRIFGNVHLRGTQMTKSQVATCMEEDDLIIHNTSSFSVCALYIDGELVDYSTGLNHVLRKRMVQQKIGNLTYFVECYKTINLPINQNGGFENSHIDQTGLIINNFQRNNQMSFRGNFSMSTTDNAWGNSILSMNVKNMTIDNQNKYLIFIAVSSNPTTYSFQYPIEIFKLNDKRNLITKYNAKWEPYSFLYTKSSLFNSSDVNSDFRLIYINDNSKIAIDEIYITSVDPIYRCSGNINLPNTYYIMNIYNITSNESVNNVTILLNYPIFNSSGLISYLSFDDTNIISNTRLSNLNSSIIYASGIINKGGLLKNDLRVYGIPEISNQRDFSILFWHRSKFPNKDIYYLNRLIYSNLINIIRSEYGYYPLQIRVGSTYEYIPKNYTSLFDEWNHLAVVYDSSRYLITVYLNGQVVLNTTLYPYYSIDNYIIISQNVVFDEIFVFNRPLSQAEIEYIMDGKYSIKNPRVYTVRNNSEIDLRYTLENINRLWVEVPELVEGSNFIYVTNTETRANSSVIPYINNSMMQLPFTNRELRVMTYSEISNYNMILYMNSSRGDSITAFRTPTSVVFNILYQNDSQVQNTPLFRTISNLDFENGMNEWTLGGNTPYWYAQNQYVYSGSYAARSGAINHSQTNWITTNIEVLKPVRLSFRYRTSSENGWDFLLFCLNPPTLYYCNRYNRSEGWVKLARSGVMNTWDAFSIDLPIGNHTLVWAYSKDSCCVDGLDTVFVDSINIDQIDQDLGNKIAVIPVGRIEYIIKGNNNFTVGIGASSEYLVSHPMETIGQFDVSIPYSDMIYATYSYNPRSVNIEYSSPSGCSVSNSPSGIIEDPVPRITIRAFEPNISCTFVLNNVTSLFNISSRLYTLNLTPIQGVLYTYNLSCRKNDEFKCGVNSSFRYIAWHNQSYTARIIYNANVSRVGVIPIFLNVSSIFSQNLLLTAIVNGTQYETPIYPLVVNPNQVYILAKLNATGNYPIVLYHKAQGPRTYNPSSVFRNYFENFSTTKYWIWESPDQLNVELNGSGVVIAGAIERMLSGIGDQLAYNTPLSDPHFNISFIGSQNNLSTRYRFSFSHNSIVTGYGSIMLPYYLAYSLNLRVPIYIVYRGDRVDHVLYSDESLFRETSSSPATSVGNLTSIQIQNHIPPTLEAHVFRLGIRYVASFDVGNASLVQIASEDKQPALDLSYNSPYEYVVVDLMYSPYISRECRIGNMSIFPSIQYNFSNNYSLLVLNCSNYLRNIYYENMPLYPEIISPNIINASPYEFGIRVESNLSKYVVCLFSTSNQSTYLVTRTNTTTRINLTLVHGLNNLTLRCFAPNDMEYVYRKNITTDFPPLVRILQPTNGSFIDSDQILISYSIQDEDPSSVTCLTYLNGSLITNRTDTSQFTHIITTAGYYNLRVVCYDSNNNTASAETTFGKTGMGLCSSCLECNQKLQDPIHRGIILSENIYAQSNEPYCLLVNRSRAELECGGNSIVGSNTGIGILLLQGDVAILNCIVRNFSIGIASNSSTDVLIRQSVAEFNDYGLYVAGGDVFADNSIFRFNNNYDVYRNSGNMNSFQTVCNTYEGIQGCDAGYYETYVPEINMSYRTYVNENIVRINITSYDKYSQFTYCSIDNTSNISIRRFRSGILNYTLSNAINHNLTLRCWDNNGNMNITQVNVVYDPTPPNVIIYSPQNNSIYIGNSFYYEIQAYDEISPNITCYINRVEVGTISNGSLLTGYFSLPLGVHSVNISCIDVAGNINSNVFTIEMRQSYIGVTPNRVNLSAELERDYNISFNISPINVQNLTNVILSLHGCYGIDCEINRNLIPILNGTQEVRVRIRIPGSFSGQHPQINLIASEGTYNTTISIPIVIRVIRPIVVFSANVTELSLDRLHNISISFANTGEGTLYNAELIDIICPAGVSCMGNSIPLLNLSPNQSVNTSILVYIPYSYTDNKLQIRFRYRSYLGMFEYMLNLSVVQPIVNIPISTIYVSEIPITHNIIVINTGRVDLRDISLQLVCPAGYSCMVLNTSTISNFSANTTVVIPSNISTFGAIYDREASIILSDVVGRVFQSRLILKIARPNLNIRYQNNLTYGVNLVNITILNNGTRESLPATVRFRGCDICNVTELNISSIQVNTSYTLNFSMNVPESYASRTYNFTLEILESNGRIWNFPISYRIPQAILGIVRDRDTFDKTNNSVIFTINNTGDLSLSGFRATLECPVGWVCSTSDPFELPINSSVSFSLSIYVSPADYGTSYIIPLKIYNNNKTYRIPLEFRVNQPDVRLFYNITTSPNTIRNYTITIINNGTYLIEYATLTVNPPYPEFRSVLFNSSISNLSPGQRVNVTLQISVPASETIRNRLVRMMIQDLYGKIWQNDLIINIDQPDFRILQYPEYLELGENIFLINISNNGTYPIYNATFQLLCPETSAYLINSTSTDLLPNQSITFGAYINMIRFDQNCTITAYNEMRSDAKTFIIKAKRMNLQIVHNLPTRIRVGENISVNFTIINLENYSINITAWILCSDDTTCDSTPRSLTLPPSTPIIYNVNISNSISNWRNYVLVSLYTSYKEIFIRSYNYSIINVKPNLDIVSQLYYNLSRNDSTIFSIINRGIPTQVNVSLICPPHILCSVTPQNIFLNEMNASDHVFNITPLASAGEMESIIILASTPSVNFTEQIFVIFDSDIRISIENRSLVLGNNSLNVTITNLRNISNNISCSVDCPAGWICELNPRDLHLAPYSNSTINLTLRLPWFETSRIRNVTLRCSTNRINASFISSLEIIQPNLSFNLSYTELEFGNNIANLTIYRDLFYSPLSLSVSCSGCSAETNIIEITNDTKLNVSINLPLSYNASSYNISITLSDGVRSNTQNYSIPTRIPIISVTTSSISTIGRNTLTNLPVRISNIGRKPAQNISMEIQCINIDCSPTNISVGNLNVSEIRIYSVNVSKGINLLPNLVRITVYVDQQRFGHLLSFPTASPELQVNVINISEVPQNISYTIPFTVINTGNDNALNVTAEVICPNAVSCEIVSFDQNYNLLRSQSRSGSIRINIPAQVTSPFYVALRVREIELENIKNIYIIPILPITFESVAPNFAERSFSVAPISVSVGDVYGDGLNYIIFSNSSGTYTIHPITGVISKISNRSYSALTTSYINSTSRMNLIGVQDTNVSVDDHLAFNAPFRIRSITSTDANRDGLLDLGIVFENSIFTIYYNQNGSFVRANVSIPVDGISLTALDFNDDQYMDFAIGDRIGQMNIIQYPYTNISYVTRNLGNEQDLYLTISDPYVRNLSAIVTGDRGGEIEVNYIDNSSIFKKVLFTANTEVKGLASVDLDRDGDLEIIILNDQGISIYYPKAIISKRVSRYFSNMEIRAEIINPFFASMINATYIDRWNPGEAYLSSTTAYVTYIYPDRVERKQVPISWIGNGVRLRLDNISSFVRIIITYNMISQVASPMIFRPELRYLRITPQTKNLGVLISDHLNERPPFIVRNNLNVPFVEAVDEGDVSGEFPDFTFINITVRDVSWLKYITYAQDPNTCAYRQGSCSVLDKVCIGDPIRTNRIVYRSSKPYIPNQIISSPKYGSIVKVESTIKNIGELAATTQVGAYLNGIQIYIYDQSLSVNVTNTSPEFHPRFTSSRLGLGNYRARGVIDPNNILPELRKDNNIMELQFNVTEYSDYVINRVVLVDESQNIRNNFVGGQLMYIVVNISNLGNSPGYVMLNASIDGQEIWNGDPVGTIECEFGRKPVLLGPIPPNSSALVQMRPVRIPVRNISTNHTLTVSIYPHITGYPEDINLSNNIPVSINFSTTPYPAELDFYNSTIFNNRLTQYRFPTYRIDYDGNRHDRLRNISVKIYNVGGITGTTNYTVYIARNSGYHVTLSEVFQAIQNGSAVLISRGNVTVQALSSIDLNISVDYNISQPASEHFIYIVLDRIGSEDIGSNVLVIRYIPIDYWIRIYPETYHPLQDSNLDFTIHVNGSRVGYLAHTRYSEDEFWGYFGNPSIEIHPRNILVTLRLNNQIIKNITLSQLPIQIYETVSLSQYPDPSYLRAELDPIDSLPNELDNQNVNITIIKPPSFETPNISIATELYRSSINRIRINFYSDTGSCRYVDNIKIYLIHNNTTITLYDAGEFAEPPPRSNILEICGNNNYTKDFYVYIPNISGQAQLVIELYRGIAVESSLLVNGSSRIRIPRYDLLFIQSDLPIIYSNRTIIVSEQYPHDVTGIFPSDQTILLNNRAKFYIYRKNTYNMNVVILNDSPIRVRVR